MEMDYSMYFQMDYYMYFLWLGSPSYFRCYTDTAYKGSFSHF